MKEIYRAVSDVLLGDTDLLGMVNYSESLLNIRRGYVSQGEWETMVVYYTQAEIVQTDFTQQIRVIPLIVGIYNRGSDLPCDEIAERIILLLNGADLNIDGYIRVYNSSYEGEVIPLQWNENLKAFEKVLRFKLLVRMDEIVGNSGAPERKRE